MPMPAQDKTLSELTLGEIAELDQEVALGSKSAIALLPEQHWKIEDFFIAAAERKGATDLDYLKGKARTTLRSVAHKGKTYKIEFESRKGVTFVIHSDGTWLYRQAKTTLTGRLQCPHAKGWIKKMIDKGTPGEFARADWAEHYSIRHHTLE